MYFRELINILFSHYYINMDMWYELRDWIKKKNWNKKENFYYDDEEEHYTNTRKAKIEKTESGVYNFEFEYRDEIRPDRPKEFYDYHIAIPRSIFFTGYLYKGKVTNFRVSEKYGTIVILDRKSHIELWTDIEIEMETKLYT